MNSSQISLLAELHAAEVETEVEGLSVPFISKADLIENKKQVGRLRDLADVEELNLIPDPLET
jgi:hypothetical protein